MREHIPGQSLDALRRRRRILLRELRRINGQIDDLEHRLADLKRRLEVLTQLRQRAA